jgi:asparagine synthase (glutamine-hydrolysing)
MALAAPAFVRSGLARSLPAGRSSRLHDLLDSLAAGRLLPMHAPLGLPREDRLKIIGDRIDASDLGWQPSGGGRRFGESPLETLAFDTQEYEFGLRLPELLLMRIDRFSLANSVEERVPFLDPALVEFAYRLPVDYKLSHGETKRILRAAVRDIVPARVLARKKQGFGAPIRTWFGSLMGDLLLSFSDQEALRAYFDVDQLTSIVERHRRDGKQEFVLWPVLNFALWHKKWIEGEALEPLLEPALQARDDDVTDSSRRSA